MASSMIVGKCYTFQIKIKSKGASSTDLESRSRPTQRRRAWGYRLIELQISPPFYYLVPNCSTGSFSSQGLIAVMRRVVKSRQ
jgi:hypothetical protein